MSVSSVQVPVVPLFTTTGVAVDVVLRRGVEFHAELGGVVLLLGQQPGDVAG
jgi:hypothetical protein